MGDMIMLHLNWRSFSLLKSLFEINLNQIKFTRFPFDRLDDDSLYLCTLRWKKQLAVKLHDDFSAKNHRASSYSWFFSQKFAFGLLRELLYSNETLEHWARGTLAAPSAKEWNGMTPETNTLPSLNRDFAIEKKTQTQQIIQ